MAKIYQDAKDKYVAVTILTVAEASALSAEELADAFHKGCVIDVNDVEYTPVSAAMEEDGSVSLTYLVGTTATKVYSKEHSA